MNVSSISSLTSRDAISPTSLSSAEAAVLVETFRQLSPAKSSSTSETSGPQAVSVLSFAAWSHFLSGPWFGIYTRTLLRESRIFPNVELCDEFPVYMPFGFLDIWKGNYRGEPVCAKAIRIQDPTLLREIESVRDSFILSEPYSAYFIPDLLLRNRRVQAHFPSKFTPRQTFQRHSFRFAS